MNWPALRPPRSTTNWIAALALLALVQAVAAPRPTIQPKPGKIVAVAEAPFRLSPDVVPRAYRLALTIDPAQVRFIGEVEIDIDLARPAQRIRLHAQDLRITAAWADHGAKRSAAKVAPLGKSQIELRFATSLPAGRSQINLAYIGRLSEQDSDGLIRRSVAGQWYAYSNFQPSAARRMAPMFDEPGFKQTWRLTLTVPQGMTAVSNTPIQAEEDAAPGFKRVRFATTPPLPSYLVALGVGPFDVLAAGDVGATPLRLLTPRGQAGDAAFAAQWGAPVLAALEAWFGSPHPFAKLDQLAVPLLTSTSAMENPGLVTWSARGLLWRDADSSIAVQRSFIATEAHEMAHQWFGNLVTPAWWDDIWLNESFASWLGDRITAQLRPDWHFDTSMQQAHRHALAADMLSSARPVERPVANDDDLEGIFDSISYDKGQALLAMTEAWIGPAEFQSAVRVYIDRHAWGSARSDDFFAALGQVDPALPTLLRSFTRQTGAPLLRVALHCEAGIARLALAQQPLLPLGSTKPTAGTRWQIPIQIRTPAGLTRHVLSEPGASIALPDATCPAWVQANVGGAGYYRPAYAPGMAAALLTRPDVPKLELLAGLDDALALNRAGELATAELLTITEALWRHPQADVVLAAADTLRALRSVLPDDAASAQRWQRAVGERTRALGWLPKPGDDDDTRRLREQLLPDLAELGHDALLRAHAGELTRAWLSDRRATLPPDMRSGIVNTAALDGDVGLFEQMLDALREGDRPSENSSERRLLLGALGHFSDPALAERARALLLDPRIDLREAAHPLMGTQARRDATRAGLLRFVAQHHAALVKRMASHMPAELPDHFAAGCSSDDARALQSAFAPHAKRYPGGTTHLIQALEQVNLCDAWRQWQAANPKDPSP